MKILSIGYKSHGGIHKLEEFEIEKPQIKAKHILVEVNCIALNPLDYRIRRGEMGPLAFFNKVKLTGSDFSGKVLEVGSKVTKFKVGDRVFGMVNQIFQGTSAEQIVVHQKIAEKIPENIDLNTAATVPLAALTAYQALFGIAGLKKGQKTLINGASGGVGTYAVQMAKKLGAEVTAVTSFRNLSWMAKLGAHQSIDYTQIDFCKQDQKYDLIFDCYGNRTFSEVKNVLNKNGLYISTIPNIKNYSLTLSSCFSSKKGKVVVVKSSSKDLLAIKQLIEEGAVIPIIEVIFDFKEIHKAYEKLESKRSK